MKTIKIITVLFITLLSFSVNAQDKLKEKAAEQTKELNAKLGEEKLTADQEVMLNAIYLDKLQQIKQIKKEVSDEVVQKEKIKEVNKATIKKVFDTVLTKEQKAALKANKKN